MIRNIKLITMNLFILKNKNIYYLLFALFAIVFLTIKYAMYLSVRADVVFLQNNKLYQYYSDYLLINENESFEDYVKSRNEKIYAILLKKNFVCERGNFFWKKHNEDKYVLLNDFSFQSYLFKKENILIFPHLNDLGYESNYIYKYNDTIFVKLKQYNINLIYEEYSRKIKCTKILPIDIEQEKGYCSVVVKNGILQIIDFQLSGESILLVKEVIERDFPKEGIFYMRLVVYNIDNMRCVSFE